MTSAIPEDLRQEVEADTACSIVSELPREGAAHLGKARKLCCEQSMVPIDAVTCPGIRGLPILSASTISGARQQSLEPCRARLPIAE
jgi:hypothetical protein